MIFRILCPLLLALFAAPVGANDLPARPRAVLKQQLVPESAVTVVVREVVSGDGLVELNSGTVRAPASTMKLLPTWAALEILGPAYGWKTRVWSDVPVRRGVLEGNLYLQGGGDPLLTIEHWWRLVADLRSSGLRAIRGDIIVDQSRFAPLDERPGDFDGRSWRTYNVLPDALLVNWQSAEFTIRPADDGRRVAVEVTPYPEGLVIENRAQLTAGRCAGRNRGVTLASPPGQPHRIIVTGTLASSCPGQSVRRVIMEPAEFAWGTFVTLWRQQGGEFQGQMRRAPVPPTARLLLTQESQSLGEIIRITNKFSSNMMARTLVLTLAAEKAGTPATTAAGEQVIGNWLHERRLDFPELVIGNGSGLSREARISGDSMARLLRAAWHGRYAPEFLGSLALGGLDGTLRQRFAQLEDPSRIRMKTGSLNGVSSIAGYVTGESGRVYVVVIFVNHTGAQSGTGQRIQEAVIDWVLRQ